MRLVVLADEVLREELLSNGKTSKAEIKWVKQIEQFAHEENADGFIDLLFDNTRKRIELLAELSKPVIINSVVDTLEVINAQFVRINAWPGFLTRQLVEASCNTKPLKEKSEELFDCLNKKIEWVPDVPGFIAARVIAMIINEAWFALEEGISTKEEIDIAMKLGTNYPFGPFEWGKQIGLQKIYALLVKLTMISKRYRPAELMTKQVIG
jgi:3-hydroxybutyryl-CoA dehydrogenase